MSITKGIIKNLKQTLSKPMGDPKTRKALEAKLKSIQDNASILKT